MASNQILATPGWERNAFFVSSANQQADEPIPSWITQEYYGQCAQDTALQSQWKPKVGDWYACKDLYQIAQIKSLEGYRSSGDVQSKYDRGKDSSGKWECDVYLPMPFL